MGATQAPPPVGNMVWVEPEKMAQLLDQWRGRPNTIVVPLSVDFVSVLEFYPAIIQLPFPA